ncbi:MAG: hypothetical protein AAF799_04100 [Myxococcota bacterium]
MACLHSSTVFFLCSSLIGLTMAGCGDDSGTTSTSSSADSGSTTAVADSGTDTVQETESGSTPATSDSGETEGETEATTTATTDATTAGETDGETEGDTEAETEGDTEGVACAELDAMACMDATECMPIAGRPIMVPDTGACLGEPEFIECQLATGCGDAITYACEGPETTIYEFLDTCIPMGWENCKIPPIELGPCMD